MIQDILVGLFCEANGDNEIKMDERIFMIDWEKGKHDDITGNRNI